jgi:glycosyltransferase involved in cell wall biosynthesis
MLPSYVLVTPARNEAQFIELTIKSVLAQSVKPTKWAIVSDGSTDGTDEIVARYAARHPWIELVRMPERRERHFAGKVFAFNAGYARMDGLHYEAIGSLDGDVSFDEGFFACLLRHLAEEPQLGLVGAPFQNCDSKGTYDYRFVSIEHVSGACQLFRRRCFDDVGGYIPIEGGGIDRLAVITARMKGWKTRTFTENVYLHHRYMGTAQSGAIKASFRDGLKDHAFGNHPLWEVFRTAYQMTQRPFVIRGVALFSGYLCATVRRASRPASRELVSFQRREQMQRLKSFFSGNR